MIFEMRQPATRITPNLGNHNRKIDRTTVRFSSVLWIFSVHRTEPANTSDIGGVSSVVAGVGVGIVFIVSVGVGVVISGFGAVIVFITAIVVAAVVLVFIVVSIVVLVAVIIGPMAVMVPVVYIVIIVVVVVVVIIVILIVVIIRVVVLVVLVPIVILAFRGGIAATVVLHGTSAIIAGAVAMIGTRSVIAAQFCAVVLVAPSLIVRLGRWIVLGTTLSSTDKGWWGRHTGHVGIPDVFWGHNSDATLNELLLGPVDINRSIKQKKRGRGEAYRVSLVGVAWLASSAAFWALVFLLSGLSMVINGRESMSMGTYLGFLAFLPFPPFPFFPAVPFIVSFMRSGCLGCTASSGSSWCFFWCLLT